jgi:hypothetical protein
METDYGPARSRAHRGDREDQLVGDALENRDVSQGPEDGPQGRSALIAHRGTARKLDGGLFSILSWRVLRFLRKDRNRVLANGGA